MLVAIDSGNTRTRVALFEGAELLPTSFQETQESIADICRQWLCIKDCEGIIISDVSDAVAVQALPQDDRLFILHGEVSLPFDNRYQSKVTQGADRIALVAGAVAILPHTPVLIIDAGTCVTYDFVNTEGVYRGGAIAPGLKMRLRAMHEQTARLPNVPVPDSIDFPGSTTRECLQVGALHGLIYEAEGYFRSLYAHEPDLRCLVTGGDAPFLVERLKKGIFADRFTWHEQLIPVGLRFILTHLLNQRKH